MNWAAQGLAFNIRTDAQPSGGFSVVIVFEPQDSEEEALEKARLISECFREDLGWDCGRSN